MKKLLAELKTKNINNFGKDFLQTWDKSREEIEATILLSEILREMRVNGIKPRLFSSGLAVSWFRDNSTRTRFSFKSAANLLGLSVQDLDENKSQISHGETTRETANMISFLTEIIGIRDDKYLGEGHKYMVQVAKAVEEGYKDEILPQRPSVINLQSDRDHPTQSVADLAHLKKYFGSLDNLKGKKMAMTWAYSPSYGKPMSVAQGTIGLMTRFGMELVLAYPKGYQLIPEIEKQAADSAKESGGSFSVSHSMKKAFRDADIVYPKSWASYQAMKRRVQIYRQAKASVEDFERLERAELRENAKHKDWECTEKMMSLTRRGKALYMHCLPADVSGLSCKEGEVEKTVFDRYRVETFKQAGHKPYVIAAMMLLTKNAGNLVKFLYNVMK